MKEEMWYFDRDKSPFKIQYFEFLISINAVSYVLSGNFNRPNPEQINILVFEK